MTAKDFIETLTLFKKESELDKVDRFYRGSDRTVKALGVKFGDVFSTAKEFSALPLSELAKLMKSKYYEVRMGALSILDFKARNKKLTESEKKALFDFYIDHHDEIDNWDYVDRAAPHVIGEYLLDKKRDILYKLAKANDPWRRRTSIVSTHAFIKRGDVSDTFKIAEMLVDDKDEYVNKAVGSWVREAGKKAPKELSAFLDKHATHMPSVTLRYAIEKLDAGRRKHYLGLRNGK
ncbi:DNA alkylation repair protein [Chryseolinea sp. T2]|uniref:DNA alkylation repair protein n=1 Tax=Chryseolinea sp. T2 TaxID=3129255 RepID=UPI0030775385